MRTRRRRSDRAGRGVLRSPGRPPVARREDRPRFWAAIAAGVASDDAAVHAGVSPAVGMRWFREAGDRGSAWAQLYFGKMYADGRGVARDDAEAVR
jgi:TPR repeat protein